MRIVLLHFRGFTDYTIQLANGLAPLVDLHLFLGTPLHEAKRALLDRRVNVQVFNKPYRDAHPRNAASINRILRAISDISPDVLHVQESQTPWFEIGLLPYARRYHLPPLVLTVHDAVKHPGNGAVVFYEQTRHISIRKAAAVIVHAEDIKRSLISRFQLPETRIKILPHGELGSLFRMLSSSPAPQREERTLLFFGRILKYKGLDYVLNAMPRVRAALPDVKLIIAGKGGDPEKFTQIAGVPCEIYPDHVRDDLVAQLFQRATALLLPYIEASQSGVANIGFGFGIPIIASAVGGLPELIHDRRDGLLVPARDSMALADAIIEILSDHDLRATITTNVHTRCATDLGWHDIARRTIDLYSEVLAFKRHELPFETTITV